MDITHNNNELVLGYLSAAPRVSTHLEAELAGPRTHIQGVISGFESCGWVVKTFIVGDRVPLNWISEGSEKKIRRSVISVLVSDILRIIMGYVNSRIAYQELGSDLTWVYERLAIFQSLGWIFKKNGIVWILETNAPLSIEAKRVRKTIVLNSIANYLETKAYKNCDILVCVSDTLKKIIVEQAKITPQKVLVVPNGVDISLFDPMNYLPRRLFEGFTIGFVGSLAPWQGLNLLIEVIKDLRGEGLDLNVTVVGDGPMRLELEGKVLDLCLDKYIKFVGLVHQDKVPEYIAGFDLGYSGQTQQSENQIYFSPIKLYEYMAMGKPVIASDFEDTRRVIREETGFLFKISNQEELKQVIRNAYQAKESLPQMGQRARDEIVKNHSWEVRVSKLITAMEQIRS